MIENCSFRRWIVLIENQTLNEQNTCFWCELCHFSKSCLLSNFFFVWQRADILSFYSSRKKSKRENKSEIVTTTVRPELFRRVLHGIGSLIYRQINQPEQLLHCNRNTKINSVILYNIFDWIFFLHSFSHHWHKYILPMLVFMCIIRPRKNMTTNVTRNNFDEKLNW